MISPVEFMRQVKREAGKVTWPTRKEVTVTTLMVFVLVVIAALFFLLADGILARVIHFILGLGG